MASLALATAQSLEVQPQAFLMVVGIAASMAFASPVASLVNTLVMAAGHYRFSDYIKIGVPMIFLMMILVVIFLPLFWPFYVKPQEIASGTHSFQPGYGTLPVGKYLQ